MPKHQPELLKKLILENIKYSIEKLVFPLVTHYCAIDISLSGDTNDLLFSHFYAQLAHESDNFRTVEEYASGKAYEGRKDLGNTSPGDGVKYKGRGYIQITGKSNYKAFSDVMKMDFVNKPQLLLDPKWALASACWFWQTRKLNALALKDDITAITKIINGGVNGLQDRIDKLAIFKELFKQYKERIQ